MKYVGLRWLLAAGLGLTITMLRAAEPLPAPLAPPRVVLKTAQNDGRMLRIPPTRDLARARTSNINIRYLEAGEINIFNDVCVGWPEDAKAAFSYAAQIWASLIEVPVPITINACWANMSPANILGHGGASLFFRDFQGASIASTFYPVALANAMAGVDLYPGEDEIVIAYNALQPWYLGTDGNCPLGRYDFVSVILHEICHGLGFLGSWDYDNGVGGWGLGAYPIVYDRFIVNGPGQYLLNTDLFFNPSQALGSQLTGGNIYFSGQHAAAANGGVAPSIYAPATWSGGSSLSHLGEEFRGTINSLMVFSFADGYSIHDPGPITMGLLQDIGWSTTTTPVPMMGINGSVNPVTISTSDPLVMEVAMDPGGSAGRQKDWWAVADTPLGLFYYQAGPNQWFASGSPELISLHPAYQGPLEALARITILYMPPNSLPAGSYQFYFGVDERNGA
ncbi:MAG: hypothetical protein LC725_02355 [Lentisphaerae bacterium]|nr:hypothetical protein [Lentisphaerota bacterium]